MGPQEDGPPRSNAPGHPERVSLGVRLKRRTTRHGKDFDYDRALNEPLPKRAAILNSFMQRAQFSFKSSLSAA